MRAQRKAGGTQRGLRQQRRPLQGGRSARATLERSRRSVTRRAEQAEAAQAHIMGVAMTLFSERGFVATSTRQIADAAGVSEGLIFHHFNSKMGLLLAAAERGGSLADRVVATLSAAEDAPTRILLRQIARDFVAFLRTDRLEAQVFRVLLFESSANLELYSLQQQKTQAVVSALGAFLEKRVASGELRPDLVSTAAAQMLLGGFLWFFLTKRHLSAREWAKQAGRFAEAAVAQWLRGAEVVGA